MVLDCMERSVFPEAAGKKQELRNDFHANMYRRSGERIDSFQIRIEKSWEELSGVGITYADDDKAYYWRNRIGLSDT